MVHHFITQTFETSIYILMTHFQAEMAHIHENMVKINRYNYNDLLNLSYLKMWSPNWPKNINFLILFLFLLNYGTTLTNKCFIFLECYCINEKYGKGYGSFEWTDLELIFIVRQWDNVVNYIRDCVIVSCSLKYQKTRRYSTIWAPIPSSYGGLVAYSHLEVDPYILL